MSPSGLHARPSRHSADALARSQTGALLLAFLLAALLVRIWFSWQYVFGAGFVRFTETDAWYHLRLVENLLAHFPVPITYDPYLKFPGGQDLNVAPGFDILVAGLSLLLGLGRPSIDLTERVAALTPPILGALTILPVYLLGRTLFTSRAGLFAAALLAILPGQFLLRSTLGFADHHVAEVFFSTVAMTMTVVAMHHSGPGRTPRAVLAGLAWTAYLASWSGGALLLLALTAGVWLYLFTCSADRDVDRVLKTFLLTIAIAALLAALLLWRFNFVRFHLAALAGAIVSVAVFGALFRYAHNVGNGWVYPAACLAVLAGMAALAWVAVPGIAASVSAQVARLVNPTALPVGEATPLFARGGRWPLVLFTSFAFALPLALAALVPVARRAARTGLPGLAILCAWFAVTAAATVGQVRFGYYLAIPVVLLCGFACDRLLERADKRHEFAFLIIVLVVFVPSARFARAAASPELGPSTDWHEALTWMRERTPEPLGDAGAYFQNYAGLSERRPYPYPVTAYSVLSWWDPGYWVTRIARRIPVTNPTQVSIRQAAEFFLAADEVRARDIARTFRVRYVIASSEMPADFNPEARTIEGDVPAMAVAAGEPLSRYLELYYERGPSGALAPKLLYYPDYYRTMAMRLYAYGGVATAGSPYVATYVEETGSFGQSWKVLTSLRPASSYDEAARVARADGTGRTRVVGVDPLQTCVPLDPLAGFTRVHASPTADPRPTGDPARKPALVQIFEVDR